MEDIIFKSNEENFRKEKSGIKCNTFRYVDMDDTRFRRLMRLKDKNEKGYIQINCGTKEFRRKISDITVWEGYVIISWREKSK